MKELPKLKLVLMSSLPVAVVVETASVISLNSVLELLKKHAARSCSHAASLAPQAGRFSEHQWQDLLYCIRFRRSGMFEQHYVAPWRAGPKDHRRLRCHGGYPPRSRPGPEHPRPRRRGSRGPIRRRGGAHAHHAVPDSQKVRGIGWLWAHVSLRGEMVVDVLE